LIALDTGALVRYLTDDEPAVAARVAELIDSPEPVQLSTLVLLETVHVLRSRPYAVANPRLADTLVDLLSHEHIVLSGLDQDLAAAAIRGARERSPRHLADALIAAAAYDAGCRALVTTDTAFITDLVPVEQLR
jgi:predicted nucleic acid-binding protein